jgi:Fe-S cluster assembly protein SufD
MKTKLEYTAINPLPVITWNWLRMNRASLSVDAAIKITAPQISRIPEGISITADNIPDGLPEITGGCGADAESLMNETGAQPVTITVAADRKISEPLILHFTPESGTGTAARQIIRAEDGSAVTVIMDYTGTADGSGFHAVQTKLYAGKNARIHLIKVQLLGTDFTHLDDTAAYCDEGGNVEITQLELGGANVYAGVAAALTGDRSSFKSSTAYLCTGSQSLDMNYVVTHTGKATTTDMQVKGIVGDQAHKIYRGTIDFRKGCSGSRGNELEETLLLSPSVVNKSIPLILCNEEDVEGTHGATIGRLGTDELFYMQTRGIPEQEAEKMMSRARIASVAHQIPDEPTIMAIESYIDRTFDYE